MIRSVFLLITITSLASAGFIGSLVPDKKVGSTSLSIGQATFEKQDNPLYGIDFGGTYYYYNSGVMFGATIGLSYTTNPSSLIDNESIYEMNGKFKLGYSFSKLARGFGVYALTDFSYLMYSRLDSRLQDRTTFAQGIGFGGGVEYRFENDLLLNALYTTTQMAPDKGAHFDYNKALLSVGFTF